MKIYRVDIDGHVIEFRIGDFGGEQVLLDGRIISDQTFAGIFRRSHHFDLPGADGDVRHVEARRLDLSKLGLGKYRVVISVDGRERCRLTAIDQTIPPNVCAKCGHSLAGQPVREGEICCPECGRHTTAALMGLDPEAETVPADG